MSGLIKNFKYIALLGVLGAGYWKINDVIKDNQHQKLELKQQVDAVSRDRDTALKNFSDAQRVSDQNKATADLLAVRNTQLDKANVELSKTVTNVRAFSQTLSNKIASTPSSQDGPVAPVLSDVVDAIQKRNAENHE